MQNGPLLPKLFPRVNLTPELQGVSGALGFHGSSSDV